jgi:hypothetical protein
MAFTDERLRHISRATGCFFYEIRGGNRQSRAGIVGATFLSREKYHGFPTRDPEYIGSRDHPRQT